MPSFSKKPQALTVGELKEMLSQYNDNDEVLVSYQSGDYWRTEVAKKITDVDEAYVVYSDYHQCDKISEDENDDTRQVVVIHL